jgi:4-hydroxythreonine-4-phosphate dehydrogenase
VSAPAPDPRPPEKPLAVSLGDPAGIGAEVFCKALSREPRDVRVYGPRAALDRALREFGQGLTLDCVDIGGPGAGVAGPGCPNDDALRASAEAVVAATRAVLSGEARALVTAPISKRALRLAGYDAPGHTELLQQLSGTPQVLMMLGGEKLKVILATTHIALKDVAARLRQIDLVAMIRLADGELRAKLGIAAPRLALAALNPHAGEGGLFGDEESTVLAPAVSRAQAMGVDLRGPFPSDTLFVRAARGEFDAVIALYHDQALIPVKLLHFGDAVNMTLGLPFVRTSPDHGVAYDIAGKGIANERSMAAALRWADNLSRGVPGTAILAGSSAPK